jgi:hypothetical protein
MRKLLMIAGLVLAAGPASAGCFDYEDTTDVVAPVVELCRAGKCEKTSVQVECSNVTFTTMIFRNGVQVSVGPDLKKGAVIEWNGLLVKPDAVTCKDVDVTAEACHLFDL